MNVLTDALRTIGGGRERDAARNSQEKQRTAELNSSCTRRPLAGSAVRRNPRSAQFGTWPGNETAAAPVTAVHTKWEFASRHHHVPSRQYPSRWPPTR
eukprot:764370-Pleurochrysis_carterae.AAC.2